MLTRDVAIKFLEETLGIDEVSSKAKHSKLTLLREFMEKFHCCIPFQNLTLLAMEPEERCLPSLDDVKDSVLSGHGGICYTRACFTHYLFTTLDYHSYLIACSFASGRHPYTHVAVIMTDIEQDGDAFMVEVGASFPSFEPIPLLALPKFYKHSFLEYKFVQEGDEVSRYHRSGVQSEYFKSGTDSSEWKKFYSFQNIPRNAEFFIQYQTPIYTQPDYGARWYITSLTMSVFPQGKAITVRDNVVKVWDEQTSKMEVSEGLNRDQMKSALQQYFPTLNHDDIIKALHKLYTYGNLSNRNQSQ